VPAKKETKTVNTEGSKLHDYELVFIVSPESDESKLESTVRGVNQLIESRRGTIAEEERWGKRRLAYPIAHRDEGIYILTRFKMDPAGTKDLESNLLISEDILRHLLIKVGS